MCEDERVWTKHKFSGLEHVKSICVLIGVRVPHSSLEHHQQKVVENCKIKLSKIEMKKETCIKNNYSGIVTVVYGV